MTSKLNLKQTGAWQGQETGREVLLMRLETIWLEEIGVADRLGIIANGFPQQLHSRLLIINNSFLLFHIGFGVFELAT